MTEGKRFCGLIERSKTHQVRCLIKDKADGQVVMTCPSAFFKVL